MTEQLVEQLRAAGKARLPATGFLAADKGLPLELVAAEALELMSKECLEQARCNGMGAERELALQAHIARLERALKLTVYALGEARRHVEAAGVSLAPADPDNATGPGPDSSAHVWQSLVPSALAHANLILSENPNKKG